MKKYLIAVLLVFILCFSVYAQEPYKLPPQEVIDIVKAPPIPQVSVSPAGDNILIAKYESMPSISYLAQPVLRLAGIRILPGNNSRRQTNFYTGFKIKNISSGSTHSVSLPSGSKCGFPQWSIDGQWLAFTLYSDNGVALWFIEANTGKAKSIPGTEVNAVLTNGFKWMPDNQHLLVYVVDKNRGNPPKRPEIPSGPKIQETAGKSTKARTYQDLLTSPYDEELFEYYATSQIVEIDILSGSSRTIGSPGIYRNAVPSPDGNFILIDRIKRPFSFSVPYMQFSHSIEMWDRNGNLVHMLADLAVADEVPIEGVPKGPRDVEWCAQEPATLVWVDALDDGDPEKQTPYRDKLMQLCSPFNDSPVEIMKLQQRFSDIYWLEAKGYTFVREYDWKRKWQTTYVINIDTSNVSPQKIFDVGSQDSYNAPGEPVQKMTGAGKRVVVMYGDWFFLSGNGASPEGDRPFLDKMNIKTFRKQRLFQSGNNCYETFLEFYEASSSQIIMSHESQTELPNYYLLDLKTNERRPLTHFENPTPQLMNIKKQLIKYSRNDGVELSGTLYLPSNYKEGVRLPLVIWAYPVEYNDPKIAAQVRGSLQRFPLFRGASQLYFVTQGYAVLDGAQMPVVGDPKTANDTYTEQIVSSAKAAVEKLNSMGIIDPTRVGVGGHSYGAFMTANLLAYSDIFSAGIARSGAYNRTLTPFGFQSERRTLWEAPELYFKISPFMYANKINEPILLIHGEADDNEGTFPIQSERLFHALKGLNGTARLVMLPYEGHGYSAVESVLDVLAEMFEWFDKYVKNKR